ncbi:MAG: hypothetical protein IPH58_16645 [Sphingobacteriales bacterium]|nr:hypothetical protein [Sphingobacteriales bacterium]
MQNIFARWSYVDKGDNYIRMVALKIMAMVVEPHDAINMYAKYGIFTPKPIISD